MNRTKSKIIVKTSFRGFHFYPGAPIQVDYLSHLHRHVFYVTVNIEVFDDDRELEFMMVQEQVDKFIATMKTYQSPASSCEMMARRILTYLAVEYGHHREYSVSIFEDNENGAEVTQYPEEVQNVNP